MQEETLREKQAVQLRLQSAVDMQAALEKSFEAKVLSMHCVIRKSAAIHNVEPDHGLEGIFIWSIRITQRSGSLDLSDRR